MYFCLLLYTGNSLHCHKLFLSGLLHAELGGILVCCGVNEVLNLAVLWAEVVRFAKEGVRESNTNRFIINSIR